MKLTVAAVGRLRPALFAPAAEEYLGRIKRYATTQVVEIREGHERSMVEAQPLESKALLEATRSCNFRIALDSRGEMVDSVALARKLGKAMQFGPDHWASCSVARMATTPRCCRPATGAGRSAP